MKITLRLRSIFFGGGLLLVVTGAFALGEYQQTKDGKTLVWNGTPKEGETSSWSGHRDKENYASGFGDLTWYTASGKVYALYYGNMVHGKFEGPVNVHTSGTTAHAYFADGGRVTSWARGPAPSKMKVPEEAVTERRKAEAEAASAAAARKREIKSQEEKHVAAVAAEPAKKSKLEPEKVRPSEHVESKPEATPEKSEITSSPTPAPETTPMISEKEAEPIKSPIPVERFEEPSTISKPVEEKPASEVPQPSATEAPRENKLEIPPQSPPREEPSIPEVSPASTPNQEASADRSNPDVSLKALVGPPSSLRTTSLPARASEKSKAKSSLSNTQLTETEAISLAEAEARGQGYHLEEYQPPKADHSTVKGKWTLFYSSKEPGTGSPLTVTIEDKTRKVEIKK